MHVSCYAGKRCKRSFEIGSKILQTFVLEKENGEYSDTEGVLVIFIDDLDRCPPKNITKVLESINLFLDQEGCFFIIGTDISLISDAIEVEYGDIEGFSGTEYVKKIIQLHFDLPLVKEDDLKNFIENELKIDGRLKPYLDIITKGLKRNQREIVRFLNSLNLMRTLGESLKESLGYEEELLIKWSVLNYSSEPFIKKVKNKHEFLIKMQETANKKDEERDAYISEMTDETVKELCDQFKGDDRIIDVLSSGEKKFATDNIETYLFLSSVVPKEPPLKKRPNIIHVKDGNLMDASGNRIDPKDLRGANLWGADLRGADLRGADLVNADLVNANLNDANLRGADLRGANLWGADLISADLISADLMNANLNDANLNDAYMGIGSNLRRTNLLGAKFSTYTLGTILLSNNWINAKFDEEVRKKLDEMAKK